MRIAGVDIPDNKRGEVGLTYIFGIGRSSANDILKRANVDRDKKAGEWTDDESNAIRSIISESYKVEGVLKSEVQLSIKRLLDIGCYRGTTAPSGTSGAGAAYQKQLTYAKGQAQNGC